MRYPRQLIRDGKIGQSVAFCCGKNGQIVVFKLQSTSAMVHDAVVHKRLFLMGLYFCLLCLLNCLVSVGEKMVFCPMFVSSIAAEVPDCNGVPVKTGKFYENSPNSDPDKTLILS